MSCLQQFIFFLLLSTAYTQDGSDAPVFEPLFSSDEVTFTVTERAAEGSQVGEVRAQGLPQETVLYGLVVDEEWRGAFDIGTSSGEITVGQNGSNTLVINGEPLSVTFQVYAYYESAGTSGNRSNLTVTVEVADVNDSPFWGSTEMEISVMEGVAVGDVVQRFTASEDDLGVNAALEYSLEQIEPNGDSEASFSIQRFTGDLTVALSLRLAYTYRVIITATDEGDPALSASLNVSIRVDPVPPTFDQLVYEVDLQEFSDLGGVDVVNVSAVALSGEPVTYSVVTWSPAPEGLNFTVGSLSGLVQASGTLDRETFSRYTITVKAYEHPDASAETTVVLHVNDVNEPPQFLRSHYSASVSEGAEFGDLFYSSIKAIDRDEGSNAEVTYSIANVSGLTTADGVRVVISQTFFIINSTTAELHVNTDLEREADVDGYHYYEITVIASDGGTPSLSATSLVTVIVTDVNNNSPMFSYSMYTFNISESVGEGGGVGTVQVSDRDEGTAANITFSLSGSGSNQFRIAVLGITYPPTVQSRPPTVTTARIYTIEQLDREVMSQYVLTVLGQDTTDQPLSAMAEVTINVLDYNDNIPQFSKDGFDFDVYEETLLPDDNGIIASITTTDEDEGSNAVVDFSLAVGAAEREIFTLDSSGSTVTLRLLRSLDRETTDSYSLRLQATDRGTPSLVGETTVIITVLDVNDETPVFSQDQYEVNVTENTETGAALVTVAASDGDIEQNAVLVYSVDSSGDGSVVSVDGETGEVELVRTVDYEANTRLEIEVTASDSGSPQLTSTATIVINIVDVNDNAPMFENSNYSVMVDEDVTTGTELIRIVATDADSGDRGAINFSLHGDQNDTFAVDGGSGAVTVATSLDREQREYYEFTVVAEDMGTPLLSSTVQLYITVLDVNDNAPIFEQSSYTVQVSEGVPVNSSVGELVVQVSATDADSGSNGDISYLLSGGEADTFHIDSLTGVVTVASPLDYETFTEPYVLTVIAQDSGKSPAMSTAVMLEIAVTDSNDNAPTFLNLPYVVRLEEGTTGPLVLLVAMATDLDEGDNGEVEFLLTGGNGLFEADRFGNVSLRSGREVDREGVGVEVGEGGLGVITLTLSAVDNGSPIQLSQTDVTILISDVNDNQPVFQQPSYSTSVSEALPVSSPIINILATDSDAGSNAVVVYSLELQQPAFDEPVFVIDNETGVISLSSELDREGHALFSLVVSATDQGTPSLSASVSVTINVTDVNDNQPVFTIPAGGYVTSLLENMPLGSEVVTVVATDRDSGVHSQITYALSDTSVPFQILNPEIGLITVSSALDRETSDQYNLIVVATDTVADSQSALQTEAVVSITVLDVNDNAPQFVSDSYEARVSENQPTGATLALFPDLVATDADTASNGVITYSLSGVDAQYFTLDPQTAEMTTRRTFDAEVVHTYTGLQVTATDDGGLNSTVAMTVVIQDENDFSPSFTTGANTTVVVSESLIPGGGVVILTATDDDVRGNILNFTLGGIQQENDDGRNPFVIDSSTGAITVGDRGLDFELSFYHVLTVIVRDSGSPSLSNSIQLLILVTDVNDNAPLFIPESQRFSVSENSPNGTMVGGVAVSDADSAELTELRFTIVGGNEGQRFAINSTTGYITTSAEIDREERDTYNLLIEARDAPELFQARTGTAVITVGDVNDHTPSFITSSVVGVVEELSPGTPVVEYTALDRDAGMNGSLTYHILSSSPADHFVINSTTGELFTATVLDRETIDTYQLIIGANDGGTPSLAGTGNLIIEVMDINDNSPRFVGSSNATIIENPLAGSLVSTNLSASDRDEGNNAELTWRIVSGNVFDAFRIDMATGAILVRNTTELDYESIPVFFLELRVEDAGDPQLSNTLVLQVNLLDGNDHAPLLAPLPPLTLPENIPVNGIVAVMAATDEDEGTNAELEFVIATGNTGGVFSIRVDRSLRLAGSLDYESVRQYELVVEVYDRGDPVMMDSTTVVVTVTDINDNPPRFVNLPSSVQIPESSVNPQLATIQINDPDSGDNGLYNLAVVSSNGGNPSPFYIIFTFLSAEGTLDYEEQSQYTLVLEASDRGVPSLSSRAELIVNIRDIDDNPPTFSEPPHYIISEAQPILTTFAILETEDLDTAENSDAFYYITGGATAQYFNVISQTGQLFLNQQLDRENVAVHVVQITAQSFQGDASGCTDLSCSVTELTVTLVDVNDNVPQWILSEFIIGVNETADLNDTIGTIQAEDADAADFGVVWYRLSEPVTPLVILEEQTGVLRLNHNLDELQGRVSPVFTATAIDNLGLTPFTTSTNIPIRIVSISAEFLVILTVARSLDEVKADRTELSRLVAMIPGARLSVYDIREHTPGGDPGDIARRQATETDIVLFGLSSDGGTLLSSQQTLAVISANASVIDDVYTITTVVVYPTPSSDGGSDGLNDLTLTIVVASVVVGVLVAVLLVTICGCCWLQSRIKQKRKHYDPGRRSDARRQREPRESVRYSTAEGVEFYGEAEGEWEGVEEHVGGWGAENHWDEDDMSQPRQVTLRPGRKRSGQATDSGTRQWDSRESEEVRTSVLYEPKDFVMDVFEDSDGDDTAGEEEREEVVPATHLTTHAEYDREEHETMELQERRGSGYRDGGGGGGSGSEGESGEEEDMTPIVRPQSHLGTVEEAEEEEEEEEEEEGEWEDGTGAQVWEEGEGEVWEEDELSPADMMTEEEARMLAAPLDEDTPPNPLLF